MAKRAKGKAADGGGGPRLAPGAKAHRFAVKVGRRFLELVVTVDEARIVNGVFDDGGDLAWDHLDDLVAGGFLERAGTRDHGPVYRVARNPPPAPPAEEVEPAPGRPMAALDALYPTAPAA